MYICICSKVTDHQIREAVYNKRICCVEDLDAMGVGLCCGKCKSAARLLLRETLQRQHEAHG